MDSRDRCPDCGSADHHGCDWPARARVEFIATVREGLVLWFATDPGSDYLDGMAVHLVDHIQTTHEAARSVRGSDG